MAYNLDLKPCPLCGNTQISAARIGWGRIWCKVCNLTLAKDIKLPDLAKIWNTRSDKLTEIMFEAGYAQGSKHTQQRAKRS